MAYAVKYGFLQQSAVELIRRCNSVSCLREMDVVEADDVFTAPVQECRVEDVTTVKVRNLAGKYGENICRCIV